MTKPIVRNENAKLLGEILAKIRNRRGYSRSKLIKKVYGILSDTEEVSINEDSLKDIENGDKVKVDRQIIQKLLVALECTSQEQFEVLLAADKDIIRNLDGSTTPASKFFTEIVNDFLYNPVARKMLESLLQDSEGKNIDLKSKVHILKTIAEMSHIDGISTNSDYNTETL